MTVLLDVPATAPGASRSTQLSYAPALPLWVLQVAVLVVLTMKLAFSLVVPPGYDDSYYWLWGQHLQWSYLDHAPMVGWGAGAAYHLLGWNALSMHALPLLSLVIDVLVMRAWAKRIAPDHWRHYFWATLAIFLASPLMMAMTSILYPDQILIAMSFGALHFLALFLADWRVGRVRWLYLFCGAVLLGFAMLSKYNGVLIGFGLLMAVVFDPKLRGLLKTWQFWLAGLLAALFLLPIIGWNVANDFATLKLHSSDRFAARGTGFELDGTGRFAWQTILYFSPFLIWPLVQSMLVGRVAGAAGTMIGMGKWIFWPCTIALVGLSLWVPAAPQVAPHWEIVAFLPFLLLAPLFMRSKWLLGAHLFVGTVAAVIVGSYFVFAPLVTDAVGVSDNEAASDYGQEQLAAAVGAAKWMYGADFAASRRYNVGSKLAWGAGSDDNIISLAHETNQFYFWRDVAQFHGQSGIIVEESPVDPKIFADYFDSVVDLGPVTTTRFGRPLKRFELYLGRGYHGVAPKP